MPKLYERVLLYLCDNYTCTYTYRLVSTILNALTQSDTLMHSTHNCTHGNPMHIFLGIFTHNHHTCTCTHAAICPQNGNCPLHTASLNRHEKIVEVLLQARATVDLHNKVEKCYLFICRL